jgi:hypothetical protein
LWISILGSLKSLEYSDLKSEIKNVLAITLQGGAAWDKLPSPSTVAVPALLAVLLSLLYRIAPQWGGVGYP